MAGGEKRTQIPFGNDKQEKQGQGQTQIPFGNDKQGQGVRFLLILGVLAATPTLADDETVGEGRAPDESKQTDRYNVSMKRVTIDYTIYSRNYAPDTGQCWDYSTLRGARKKARELGVGSLIVRNFNRNKPGDWWQSTFC